MNSLPKNSMFQGMLSMLSVLSFFCLISLTNALFAQNDLFTEVAVENLQLTERQTKILTTLQQDKTTTDLRVVVVNLTFLANGQSINLNLFPGKRFAALTSKIDKRSDNDFTWYGSIPGKVSNIVLSVYEDAVVGFMTVGGESYDLRYLGEGLNVIIRVDPSQYPPCGNSLDFSNLQRSVNSPKSNQNALPGQVQNIFSKSSSLKTSQGSANLLSSGSTIIKVLVAYTPAARDGEGGVNAMNALICNSIAAANQSYNNSNIPIQLELSFRVEVSYTESRTYEDPVSDGECPNNPDIVRPTDLVRFQNPSDGYMDEIHDLRALSAADVAVLIFDTTGLFPTTCGAAFEIYSSASTAFCIVHFACSNANEKWSFAHEIGHLQGARHDNDNCIFPFAYGHGYFSPANWKTMMAVKEGKPRIQYWSNPNATFGGIPMGTATFNDNARVLTETAPSVENFEQEGGTVVITNDVTVGSNSTLNIDAGTTIKFVPTAGLTINGSIQANGTASEPITFTSAEASPAAGDWSGIWVQNASASSSFDYCVVEYSANGIRLESTSGGVTVEHSTLRQNTVGLISQYSSPVTLDSSEIHDNGGFGCWFKSNASPGHDILIKDNTIRDNTLYGLYMLSGANADFGDNQIHSNGQNGILCVSNTSPNLRGSANGSNWIYDNGRSGVKTQTGSWPYLGSDSAGLYGYNHIYDNSVYEIENANGGSQYLVAERNYWSASSTTCAEPSNYYGLLDYYPQLPPGCPPTSVLAGPPNMHKTGLLSDASDSLA